MSELMNQMNSQTAELPGWVQLWMNWMTVVFLAAILFVKNHVAARVAIVTFLLTFLGAIGVFYLTRNIHLFSLVHLALWTPLLIYVYRKELRPGNVRLATPYGIWLILLCATILISLLFDVRDAALALMGQK